MPIWHNKDKSETLAVQGDGACDDPSYDLSAYAVFLLAEMREQQAFPKLLRLLTLSRDALELALGDIITYMGNSLYSTYNGDLPAAKEILIDSSLDPFARGAALDLMEGLFRDGRLPREEFISYLRGRAGCEENDAADWMDAECGHYGS